MNETFAEELGMDESQLGDDTKASLKKFVDTILDNMVQSYEIKDVTEDEDGVGTAYAAVTFGFDPDKIDDIDVEGEAEKAAEKYMEDHMSEMMELYNSGGEDAMVSKMLDDLLGDLFDSYAETILESGEMTNDLVFTVKKIDYKWLVTEDKEVE